MGHSVGKTARFFVVVVDFQDALDLHFGFSFTYRSTWQSCDPLLQPEQESESDCLVWLCNPIDLVHGILQVRILEWVAFSSLQGIFPTQGSNPGLPHCRRILYQLSHKGSARILEWVAYPFSSGSSRLRNWTRVYLHCRRVLYQLSYERSYLSPKSWLLFLYKWERERRLINDNSLQGLWCGMLNKRLDCWSDNSRLESRLKCFIKGPNYKNKLVFILSQSKMCNWFSTGKSS